MCYEQRNARRGKLLADTLEVIEEERGQLTLKFHVAKLILTGVSYETGTKPFQDLELLLKIRNSLTHPRPFVVQPDESGSPVDPIRKFREQLRSLNILAEVESSSFAPLSTSDTCLGSMGLHNCIRDGAIALRTFEWR